MSFRHEIQVALLGTAFLSSSAPSSAQVQAETRPTKTQQLAFKDSLSAIGRTVFFRGESRRVEWLARMTNIGWAVLQELRPGTSPGSAALFAQLSGVEPIPLPRTTTVRKPAADSETAVLQRTYRKLHALGLTEEAAEIAAIITTPDHQQTSRQDVVNAVATERDVAGGIQTTGLNQLVRPGQDAGKDPINCRFDGVSLDVAAKFLQDATGTRIRVRTDDRPLPIVHFSCQNLAADRAIARMVESCGWTFEREGEGILLVAPQAVLLRASRLPILR